MILLHCSLSAQAQAGANGTAPAPDDSIVDMTVFSQLLEMCVSPLPLLCFPLSPLSLLRAVPCSRRSPSISSGLPSPRTTQGRIAPNRGPWRMLSVRPRGGGRTNGPWKARQGERSPRCTDVEGPTRPTTSFAEATRLVPTAGELAEQKWMGIVHGRALLTSHHRAAGREKLDGEGAACRRARRVVFAYPCTCAGSGLRVPAICLGQLQRRWNSVPALRLVPIPRLSHQDYSSMRKSDCCLPGRRILTPRSACFNLHPHFFITSRSWMQPCNIVETMMTRNASSARASRSSMSSRRRQRLPRWTRRCELLFSPLSAARARGSTVLETSPLTLAIPAAPPSLSPALYPPPVTSG